MPKRSLVSQFGRFVGVGLAGFGIDTGITVLLVGLGSPPWAARLAAIAVAMVFTWVANGRFTFARRDRVPASTFVPYVLVALGAAVVNYGVFLAVLRPLGSVPLAVAVATAISMVVSFVGYRSLAFGR